MRHHASLWGPIAGVAVATGIAAATFDWRLLVPLGLGLPLVTVVVLDALSSRDVQARTTGPYLRPPGATAGASQRQSSFLHGDAWLSWTWAALFFGSTLRLFGGRRPADAAASGQLSLDNALELALTGMAVLVLVSAIRDGWPLRIPRLAQVFGGFAILTVFSVTWSRLPLLSAARALQFTILAAFVAYCASRAASEAGFVDHLLVRVLRYITFGAVALAMLGVAEGFLAWDRFTWRGTHPNTAAAIMLVPCVALLFHPQRSQITRPFPWLAFPVVLLPLVYATGSRANVAGAGVAVLCGWFVMGMRDKRVGALGIGSGLIIVATATAFAADRLAAWLLRGQGSDAVVGLNGRVELWDWVLANPLGSEIWGVGLGAARGVLPVSWNPTNVHSAWIDILQTLGVLGLALMGAVVVSVIALTVLRRSVHGAWLVGFVAVSSLNSITIAQPGVVLILLCLAIVVVSNVRGAGLDMSPEGVTQSRDLRPQVALAHGQRGF